MSGATSMSGNGKGSSIPASSMKMVQSLKEIVNCPELEIYSMLKECNMDPNEAVNRLLTQDPFREVKSKREKKKENKDTTVSRPRGTGSTSVRGGRGGCDRFVGHGSSTQSKYTETGNLQGKPAHKKENGSHAYISLSTSFASTMTGNTNWQSPFLSDSVSKENKESRTDPGDGLYLSSQPPSGFQSAWVGAPGQVSMADIVKMGRAHNKAANTVNPSNPSAASHHTLHSSQRLTSDGWEINHEPTVAAYQNFSVNEEWPAMEQPSNASLCSAEKAYDDSDVYTDSSNIHFDRVNQNLKVNIGEVQEEEDETNEDSHTNHVGSSSASDKAVQEDNSAGASHYDNGIYDNKSSYQPLRHKHQEVEDGGISLSSMAANLQQLSLQKDELVAPLEEESRSVVIPNHLQVQSADCLHLSFGSFGSGISGALPGQSTSRPIQSDVEEPSSVPEAASVGPADARNPEYYVDEHLRATSDENLGHGSGVNAENYNSPSDSQPEELKQQTSEADQGNQHVFPSSMTGYNFENNQQLAAAYGHLQTSSQSQIQHLSPFSSMMAYTNSLPSTLLASTVQQPPRESDLSYSPFLATHTMAMPYSNAGPSVSGSSISIPEALKTSNLSMPQGTQQTLSGGNVTTGPTLPQHMAMNPYSQPTLPLGHFANMISYPFLPQSYTYMPSAFQQQFGGNSSYHQSLAAVLPQYKNSVSVSSLPQSGAIASGYGGFGNPSGVPGNFSLNPPAAPAGTSIGYDDVIGSQYKDASHLLSLQQLNGSRTISGLPTNAYYGGFQGQNQQQPTGYRQQTHSYPNFYHSQEGLSMEQHQAQNSREGSLGGSQGQPSKQSQQQIWQNSY